MSVESRALSGIQVLIVGVVCVLAVSVWPSCGLKLDSRSSLKARTESVDFDGGQFRLLHPSHHQSPLHVPGLNFHETVRNSIRSDKHRAAVLSRKLSGGRVASTSETESDTSFTSPLSPLGGSYVMEISMGTPPQTFYAIADTGSDLIWVQGAPCQYCDQQLNSLFYPENSSTYSIITCGDPNCSPDLLGPFFCADNSTTCPYYYAYGDGTQAIGDFSYETITLTATTGTTKTASNVRFGCDHVTIGNLSGPAGIVGLGQGPLSFTSQLGSLYGNKFSYCLVNIEDSMNMTSLILFGNSSIPKVATQYTPIVKNNISTTFYYIGLTGINVNGEALDIPPGTFDIQADGNGGIFVDSGTTLTYLLTAAYNPLLDKMQSLIKYPVIPLSNITIGLDLCFDLSNVPNPTFPNVSMVFQGFTLDLAQENILFPVNSTTTCFAFAEGFGVGVFGMIQQQNFQIFYDRENYLFGFAKVQCDSLSSH